jgi:thiamine-monophosphate kinase
MPLPERALIAEIRKIAASPKLSGKAGRARGVIVGIGDDCSLLRLPTGIDSLVTTDFSLEGVHFRREWHPAVSVGHRCLARGLSDIAAMGGEPTAVFLSVALPLDLPQAWVRGFVRGLIRLGEKYGAKLAGGDTAQSPTGVLADIVVVGTVPKGEAILRSGAHPGDRIYVSGELGGSAAAVHKMLAHPRTKLPPRYYRRHFYPDPRIDVARALREKKLASAMIDTSDGLSTDLAHICEESGVGAQIDASLIPRARVGNPAQAVELDVALHGGEDYELLFTVRPGKHIPTRIAGVPLTQIGHVTRSRKILLTNPKGSPYELEPRGWEHFRK